MQTAAELAAARSKITQLGEQLLTRTEELRAHDQQRAELSAELEIARANAKQLASDMSEQKRTFETERKTWVEQMTYLRGLLDQRTTTPEPDESRVARPPAADAGTPVAARTGKSAGSERPSANNPVLGSIMEQFGKLRQQRASDRQAGRNAR
jgi:chromosome segregation ATPase